MRTRALGALLISAAIAGCGGATNSADVATQIRATFTRYEAAVARGNPGLACRYMSAAVQRRVTAVAAGTASESCPLSFGQELLGEDALSRSRQGELATTLNVRVLSVRDGRARVVLSNRVGSLTETGGAAAVLERGQWRISEFPGQETAGRYLVYRVPSVAMAPTLTTGDIVLIDPQAFATRSPAVGDIVLVHPPAASEVACAAPGEGIAISGASTGRVCDMPGTKPSPETFIKRIVAGPGDTVAISDGRVIRNGQPEPTPFPITCTSGIGCSFPHPVRIPADTWFVVGDDRAQSADSREWGPVRTAWIVGKLARVVR
jgi:signal peptidase I